MNEEDKAHVISFVAICKDCYHLDNSIPTETGDYCLKKVMWVGGILCTEYKKNEVK